MAQQGENTGLIDLNVLTQARAAARPTPSLFPPPSSPSSLPPAAFAVEVQPPSGTPKRRAWFDTIAPLVVPLSGTLVIALATFAAVSSFPTEEPVVPPALAASMPATAVGLPPAQPAPPDPTVESPTSAESSESRAAAPAPRAFKSGAAKAGANVSAPPHKPAGDRCGCKGNFDCILRCSAKGK